MKTNNHIAENKIVESRTAIVYEDKVTIIHPYGGQPQKAIGVRIIDGEETSCSSLLDGDNYIIDICLVGMDAYEDDIILSIVNEEMDSHLHLHFWVKKRNEVEKDIIYTLYWS